LRAVRQLADDVIEHMRRHGGRATGRDFGGDGAGNLKVEIGRLQAEFRFLGLDEDVGEDRNGIAALDHAMDVAQRL
jgi:hypothetical protein